MFITSIWENRSLVSYPNQKDTDTRAAKVVSFDPKGMGKSDSCPIEVTDAYLRVATAAADMGTWLNTSQIFKFPGAERVRNRQAHTTSDWAGV